MHSRGSRNYWKGSEMKHLILALALILPLSVGAFKPEDLEKLKKTKECPKCDLSGADLEGANLRKANLEGVNLKETFFCKTTMPDGTKNNTDCP